MSDQFTPWEPLKMACLPEMPLISDMIDTAKEEGDTLTLKDCALISALHLQIAKIAAQGNAYGKIAIAMNGLDKRE